MFDVPRSSPISEPAPNAFGSHNRYETDESECLRLSGERNAALSSSLLVLRGETETKKLLLDTMPHVLSVQLLMMLEMIICIQ